MSIPQPQPFTYCSKLSVTSLCFGCFPFSSTTPEHHWWQLKIYKDLIVLCKNLRTAFYLQSSMQETITDLVLAAVLLIKLLLLLLQRKGFFLPLLLYPEPWNVGTLCVSVTMTLEPLNQHILTIGICWCKLLLLHCFLFRWIFHFIRSALYIFKHHLLQILHS